MASSLIQLYDILSRCIFTLTTLPAKIQWEDPSKESTINQDTKNLYQRLCTEITKFPSLNLSEQAASETTLKKLFLEYFKALPKEDRLSFFNTRFVLGKVYPPIEDEVYFISKILVQIIKDGETSLASVQMYLGKIYEAYMNTKDLQYFGLITHLTYENDLQDFYFHYVKENYANIPIRCNISKDLLYCGKKIIKIHGKRGKTFVIRKREKK